MNSIIKKLEGQIKKTLKKELSVSELYELAKIVRTLKEIKGE